VFIGWFFEQKNERDCRTPTKSIVDWEIGVVREELETGE